MNEHDKIAERAEVLIRDIYGDHSNRWPCNIWQAMLLVAQNEADQPAPAIAVASVG
jgi:hypothetical protein